MALRDDVPSKGFPYELPAVRHMSKLQFHERVTFIVGDNGMGKSTLVEALAIVAGFPPEGGSRSGVRETDPTVSELCKYVRLTWENTRPSLDRDDIRRVAYNDVFSVDLWRRFLNDPQRYVSDLLADDD